MRSTESPPSRPTILDLWWPIALPVALTLLTLGVVSAALVHLGSAAPVDRQ
jgi:hypothetical protein